MEQDVLEIEVGFLYIALHPILSCITDFFLSQNSIIP
jgi:hypothetical protein